MVKCGFLSWLNCKWSWMIFLSCMFSGLLIVSDNLTKIVVSGALNGVVVEVPALGEVVHAFALCFLVPGQYSLLGAAVINDPKRCLGPESNLLIVGVGQEPLCYSGPPFTVDVIGTS